MILVIYYIFLINKPMKRPEPTMNRSYRVASVVSVSKTWYILENVHTKPAKFTNASFSLCFGPPSRLQQCFSLPKTQLFQNSLHGMWIRKRRLGILVCTGKTELCRNVVISVTNQMTVAQHFIGRGGRRKKNFYSLFAVNRSSLPPFSR